MAVHASHAALPYPIKNARFSLLIPYLDADGDPTAPTTPDTEVSKDNGAAADCAEEASATSGMDGMALLTLSGAEMDASCVALNAKVASGPKATLATLYPRVLALIGSGTLSAGSAGGGTLGTVLAYDVTGCFIRTTGGTGGGGTGGANNQVRKIATYTTSTGAFTVVPNWETTPSTDTTYDILLPEGVTLGMLRALNPSTAGRTLGVESDGHGHADLKEWLGSAPSALQSGRVDSYLGAAADAVLTAAKFASGAFDAVWAVTTRLLTAGTNIVLAKGTGVTGLNDLSVSDVRTAVGLASANLDTQLDALPTAAENASAVWGAGSRTLTSFGSLVSDIWAAVTDSPGVTTLLSRVPAALFAGITSLAQWLGLIAGKQTGNSTARTELRATGAGSGTYDETTDSQEALRDRGDAAWLTATGFSTLDAAGVRSAVGLASANLDTQLTNIHNKTTNLPIDPADQSLIIAATDALATAIAGLNNLSAAQVLTQVLTGLQTQVADNVPALGQRPTPNQALYAILQILTVAVASGTLLTVKKPDGSTLMTFTLNDATNPTSVTRAS